MKLRVLFLILLALPAYAAVMDAPLPDAAQEARAQALFHQLRCVVCESASIAESPAEVASDMRRAIRERISAGEQDNAILDFLVARYGEGILMQPRVKPATWPLWFGPLLLLIGGGAALLFYFRKPS